MTGLAPLEGGFSGETFAAGDGLVVRIHAGRSRARGPLAVDIDAAVLHLVRGLLPVPTVVEVRRPVPEADLPALMVTTRLPGTRLDLVLPHADAELRRRIGTSVGGLLRTLRGIPFLSGGEFTDAALTVCPVPEATDLRTWVEKHLHGTALSAWPAGDVAGLLSLADRAQDLLDPTERVCLVHGDVNPKNLLVDPGTGEVTGLVDWEYAHAGSPYADLGNLLRFERDPELASAVLSQVDGTNAELVERARAADLLALVELASRRPENPVAERAHGLLTAMVRANDLHAAPPRVAG
ncbi:phosphotransferase [Nocardioides sp. MJB4]|uniref:Phosphotransferase n=2 Tax=Nocardioides donggukensis TaxID=2774019 RepID=A0A927Q018_9ACTN|nr:phosphotransferase [Nocardioides donggukensis]